MNIFNNMFIKICNGLTLKIIMPKTTEIITVDKNGK